MDIRFETDPKLSLKSKGTLTVCKALIEQGINPNTENIKANSLDAETSIASSLRELKALGYYKAIKYRESENKGFNWRFEISETREASEDDEQ